MATNYNFFYNIPYPLGIIKYFKSKVFPHLWFKRGSAGFNSTEQDILMNEPHVFAVGA